MGAYLWMLIGSLFFAIMALLAESLKEQFSFPWISAIRSGVATCLAFALAIFAGSKLVFFKPFTLWIRSLSGWISMMFCFYAMTHYDVEIVLALTNSYPIWVAILSWPILGIVPSLKSWIALTISCVGMGWIYYGSYDEGTTVTTFSNPHWAIPAAILASIMSGVALINLHRLKGIDARAIVTHFSAVATLGSLLVWLALPLPKELIATDDWSLIRLIGVGIAATGGQLCLTKAFSTGSPANVSIVGLSQVVFAAIFKWFLERQVPSLLSTLGMLLVMAATIWVILGKSQPKQDAAPTTTT
ncbi:MAG: DMT family transporter [Pirellula sp.]|jgi:drug/metabolite transporter (DMT)-like permease